MSVRICENGIYRDATAEEIARMEAEKPDPLPEETEEATEADYHNSLREMGVRL